MGDQSTPVISSRMKLRSMTPFDDVSEVKCMVLPFGTALFRRSRRHLRLSPDREHEWEHPHGYCIHGFSPPWAMSRTGARYQPESNPVQPFSTPPEPHSAFRSQPTADY